MTHRAQYNNAWIEWFKDRKNPSRQEVLDYGRELAKQFQFDSLLQF